MILNLILLVLVGIFLISTIYFILQTRKLNKEINKIKKTNVGTLILADKDSFYLELRDASSIEQIYKSEHVVFDVKQNIKTLN